MDRVDAPLYGDAGTATALEYDTEAKPMFFNVMSDGKQKDAIIAYASGLIIDIMFPSSSSEIHEQKQKK